MSANAENRAWRRSSQQIPPRNQSSSSQQQREDSNSRNNKENNGNNMVRKAQNPSPAPPQNPWNKGGAGSVKGAAAAASHSGTSTPKEKAPAVEKAVEQPPTQQQGNNGFNADDVRKMFEEDAKVALAGLGDEVVVKLPDEGKKQAWGTQRKPGTMANGQSFAAELARQLAELEQNKPSSDMDRLYDGHKSDEEYGDNDLETDLSYAITVPAQDDTKSSEPWNDKPTKVDLRVPLVFQPLQLTSAPFVPFAPISKKTMSGPLPANSAATLSATTPLPRAAELFDGTASETSGINTPSSDSPAHLDMATRPASRAASSATPTTSPQFDASIIGMVSPKAAPMAMNAASTQTPSVAVSATQAIQLPTSPRPKTDSSPIARAPADQGALDCLISRISTSGSDSEPPLRASQTNNRKKKNNKKQKKRGKGRTQAAADEQRRIEQEKIEQDQDKVLDELVANMRPQHIQAAKNDKALVLRAAEEGKYDLGTASNEEKDALLRCITRGDFIPGEEVGAGGDEGTKSKKRRPAKKAARKNAIMAERIETARFLQEKWASDAKWTTRNAMSQQNDDRSFEALLPTHQEQRDIYKTKFSLYPARFPLDELDRLRKMRDVIFLRNGFPTVEFMQSWRALYLETQEKWPKDEGTFPYQEYSNVMELYFEECQKELKRLQEEEKEKKKEQM